jgi:hypothetical protein
MEALESKVADPHHLTADPEPSFHFYADPDPTFYFHADPDPARHRTDTNLQTIAYRPLKLLLGPLRLHLSL